MLPGIAPAPPGCLPIKLRIAHVRVRICSERNRPSVAESSFRIDQDVLNPPSSTITIS